MAITLQPPVASERQRSRQTSSGSGGFGSAPPSSRGWGGGDSGGDGYHWEQRCKLAVWVGISGIVMFFAAISSAMVVSSAREDWLKITLPSILWASTALLFVSSLTFEMARRAASHRGAKDLRRWVLLTAALGVGFLATQIAGCVHLFAQGVALAGQPSGAFFYLLTTAHGLHVFGGICVLTYVVVRTLLRKPWPRPKAVLEAAALYWHFMGVLWVYILGLLLFLG